MSLTSWFLASSGGTRHRLPREMIFVGRDDCELMLQSRSVDKQHAVINYEAASDEHKVKDLGSLNGTFVNEVRIQEQMYVTLKIDDKLRFGYDTNLFTVLRGELHVPEEALKHEKFTSQLQLAKKPCEGEPSNPVGSRAADSRAENRAENTAESRVENRTEIRAESRAENRMESRAESRAAEGTSEGAARPNDDKMAGDLAALHRGTPLYGQPSWWGDGDADDENSSKQDAKVSDRKQENSAADGKDAHKMKQEGQGPSGQGPSGQEPSYFEIPTKESLTADRSIHEVPTKDTEGVAIATTTTAAEAAAQGHASFTIEFDNTSPGKVTVRDHLRPRPRKSPQPGGAELSTLQAAIMASESKVADWLAQNDPPLARMESTEDDSKSMKSDEPVHLNRLKGSKHVDGTQSDSENGAGLRFSSRRALLEQRLRAGQGAGPGTDSRTFMIEFLDEDDPRQQRSYSFSQAGEGLFPMPTGSAPLADCRGVASPLASGRLPLRQRSDDCSPARSSTCPSNDPHTHPRPGNDPHTHSRPGNDPHTHPHPGNVPHTHPRPGNDPHTHPRPGNDPRPGDDHHTHLRPGNDPHTHPHPGNDPHTHPRPGNDPRPGDDHHSHLRPGDRDPDDDLSDKGTYTIELENRNPEEEEARRMIDKVFGVEEAQVQIRCQELQSDEGKERQKAFKGEMRKTYYIESGTLSEDLIGVSSPRWMSQWAVLAANHTRTDPEGSGAESPAFIHQEKVAALSQSGVSISVASVTSSSNHTERKRRTLPQPPTEEKAPPGRGQPGRGPQGPGFRSEIGEKQDTEPQEKERQVEPGPVGGASLAQGAAPKEPRGGAKQGVSSKHSGRTAGEKGGTGRPLVRQGSFTVDKPSGSVPQERIPRIPQQGGAALLSRSHRDAAGNLDTALLLKDTEAVMAFLEAKLLEEARADSISPESDIDTASTTSQATPKRRTLSSLHRDKSTISSAAKMAPGARERLERKAKPRPPPATPRATPRARQPSLDLTDDDLASSLPLSSDQETSRAQPGRSKAPPPAPPPRPRPTRASLLRRARLGDSDPDPDADRVSVASEVSTTSSTSRPPGRRTPSRLDVLATPRHTRPGSARSDSEATPSSRISTETLLRLGLQAAPRIRANSVSKLPDAKSKASSTHSTPSASNRWRRLPPEYASTSEDEFGSNRHPSKHARLRPSTAPRGLRPGGSAPSTPGPGGGVMKHRAREQEEYIRDWTAHSEEIARISQDLAKDLAMLAREIHDVAGEIDSVSSSGTAPSTTVSTTATTPGSAIDTREELLDRVFDESLTFRKTPPTSAHVINGRPVELRPRGPDGQDPQSALRRRTWSRDEVVLDSLLLTSVSQLSVKIRHNVDKTAGKIRILFKDKDMNWEEIESKLRSEGDVPLLKTSNQEIAVILQELKKVEKQLQVINVMVDPDGTLEALASLGLTSPTLSTPPPDPQGPLPQPPLVPGPSEERDFAPPLNRFTPSGEENSLPHK